MKLYAKVHTDRCTIARGSNSHIDIRLNIGREHEAVEIAFLTLDYDSNDGMGAYTLSIDAKDGSKYSIRIGEEDLKGEKQKGEHVHEWGNRLEDGIQWCKHCDATRDTSGGIIE